MRLSVPSEHQTLWLTQRQIAELHKISVKTANEHLVNIFREGELDAGATVRIFRRVQTKNSRQSGYLSVESTWRNKAERSS